MIPTQVKHWLALHYSEDELHERIGGTRQNWSQRRPRLRKATGMEILPDVWIYAKEATDAYLSEMAKHRP